MVDFGMTASPVATNQNGVTCNMRPFGLTWYVSQQFPIKNKKSDDLMIALNGYTDNLWMRGSNSAATYMGLPLSNETPAVKRSSYS